MERKNAMRMLKMGLLIPGFFFIADFFSCRHQPIVPTEQVSFQNDVLPVILANCTQSGCHGQGAEAGSLVSYDDIIAYVTAGQPQHSRLYKVITAQMKSTVMPPPPMAPLDNSTIQNIYSWILQGAKNN